MPEEMDSGPDSEVEEPVARLPEEKSLIKRPEPESDHFWGKWSPEAKRPKQWSRDPFALAYRRHPSK